MSRYDNPANENGTALLPGRGRIVGIGLTGYTSRVIRDVGSQNMCPSESYTPSISMMIVKLAVRCRKGGGSYALKRVPEKSGGDI